jgi:Peptidase family S41
MQQFFVPVTENKKGIRKAWWGCSMLAIVLLASCATSQKNYSPVKKFAKEQLQQDFTLLRNILEAKHPSLYWYNPKDSMDMYFDRYYHAIQDSMTELQFGWRILAPLTHQVHCGHTSFSMSKAYNRWISNRRLPSFPYFVRVWGDTMLVTGGLNRKDSIIKRGTVLTGINGWRTKALTQRLFNYMPADGYADNVNYMRLGANFPYYHRNIMGLSRNYDITYLDSTGQERAITVPLFQPVADTGRKSDIQPLAKLTKAEKRERRKAILYNKRFLQIDTVNSTAVMTVNTFSGGRLRSFFRRSFKKLRKENIHNLVIDLRSNGGGKINLSTLLTKYVTRRSFKIADTAIAKAKGLGPYTRYIKGGFFNSIGLGLFGKRLADGRFHFRYFERKTYHPKRQNHFDSSVYVLINGSTFSASTLFAAAVKGQPGVTLVGEEAGGGWHGNTGVMIPDITLPNTKMRVRLPLVRIVQYRHVPRNGLGVMPDVYVPPNYDAFMKGYDKKMKVVQELIKAKIIPIKDMNNTIENQ